MGRFTVVTFGLLLVCVFFFCFTSSVYGNVAFDRNTNTNRNRTERRVRLPFLGLGPACRGCPPHYCDDDPAIIHGYCCGCARFYDVLPVVCSPLIHCPLNLGGLCDDYEYMMHCCCD